MSRELPTIPQRGTPAHAVITSVEWLFEPYWSGERLIAKIADGHVSLSNEAGEPAGPDDAIAGEALLAAVDAEDATIDGIWTTQPFPGDGAAQPPEALEGLEVAPRPCFVAVDLLALDGQSLAEVPLQERRRLLGAIVTESRRVRISPAVRVPQETWIAAWRAGGFTRYVAKHVNSRYHAGEQSEDWLILSSSPQQPISAGRIGRRPEKPRLIED